MKIAKTNEEITKKKFEWKITIFPLNLRFNFIFFIEFFAAAQQQAEQPNQ